YAHPPTAAHEDGADGLVGKRPPEPAGGERERARHEAGIGGGSEGGRARARRRHALRRPAPRAARRRRGVRRLSAIRSSSSRMNSWTSRKDRYTDAKRT